MKTLEFKLALDKEQAATIDRWLDVQRWVWNTGLRILKDFEAQRHYNKHDKAYAPCCPIPWKYHWEKDESGNWQSVRPYSEIARHDTKKYLPPVCDRLAHVNISNDSEYSLIHLFAKKLHEDKPWYLECPYKLTQGTVKALATAWKEYRKGRLKAPRFKRRGENKTMSAGEGAKVKGDRVQLPLIGLLKVRSLSKRWPEGLEVKTYRITKEPSGYYLLLVGSIAAKPVKPSNLTAGFDAGVAHLLTDDQGKHTHIPYALKRRLKQLKRLSRKASKKQKGSANQKKAYAKLANAHEKIRRDRKAWHHKVTTFAVRKYGAIAVEDLKLQNMTRRSKPKPKADGTGYERNGAAAKSGLNRALLDAGIGQMYRILEEKCNAYNRDFKRVSPAYSSQTCNACGVVDKKSRRSQSEFVCVACGHADNADANAAKNIRMTAFPERVSYPALAGKVTPVDSLDYPIADEAEVKQEEVQASPRSDATAISNSGNTRETSGEKAQKTCNPIAIQPRESRSAQAKPKSFVQLGLWDAAPEAG